MLNQLESTDFECAHLEAGVADMAAQMLVAPAAVERELRRVKTADGSGFEYIDLAALKKQLEQRFFEEVGMPGA